MESDNLKIIKKFKVQLTFDGNLVLVDVVVVVAWVVDGVVDDQLAGTDVELTVDDWLIS